MAFTDNSDLYGALHEEGVNRVVKHIKQQRPSLFNYGTALIQANPELLCEPIDAAPGVSTLITVQPPLPLFGAEQLALNYCFQFSAFDLEFHPGNVINLPAELNPPLPVQRFAFRAKLCGGIGCPSRENRPLIDFLIRQTKLEKKLSIRQNFSGTPQTARSVADTGLISSDRSISNFTPIGRDFTDVIRPDVGGVLAPPEPRVTVFPTQNISCFCLELFAKGQSTINANNDQFSLKLDGLEIVDLRPEGLENSLECYFLLVANNVIFPQVNEAVSSLLFGVFELGELGSLTFSAPSSVANNPAIEENQLKLFMDVEDIDLNIPPIVIGDDEDESESPEITRTTKNRVRTGPAHITAALSEDLFSRIFRTIQDTTNFQISGERTIADGGLGKVVAEFDVRFHLDNGSVNFANNNTINIDELDIKWDKLSVKFKFDIREICTPKVCIPFTDICTPQWCIFESDSDFDISLNIPTIFTSEVSITASPKVYYGTAPVTQWLLYLDPGPIDIDIIDVSDTIGDILDNAIEAIVDALNLPDIVEDVLGVFADVIRTLLDIGDDIGEWISDLIFNTFGISVGISELIAGNLADKSPLLKLPDPLVIMPAESGPPALPAVGVPIEFLGAEVNADEMILTLDIKE
ncbi:hypothetical protein OKW21_001923 [Catalinimonas alkaloidigena]|uniref:hypothetical protein n=1 Tax=Catalinimonas alkaloidigena TaxID=1075417 RepID=UPI0024072829|nr:hypothetical protein [Catalinimonas alkaloidigena]MDF9796660.1 hypothetical protein [Catalinimonas alkaloidigena]